MSIYSDMYTFMVPTVVCVLDLFVMLTHLSLGNNTHIPTAHHSGFVLSTCLLC